MKVDPIKTSFSGGEFGPPLFGRTDIAQYANACEIVENMLCRPYGSAISTPGTRFIREVKDSSKKTKLIPFVFNRTDANVIEMGDKYMRFFPGVNAQLNTPMVLDYMEYNSDSLAQDAYITNSSEAINQQALTEGGGLGILGDLADTEYRDAQSFQLSVKLQITSIEVKRFGINGTPTGSWTLRIETNNSGVPSGTLANANASIVVSPPGTDGTSIKGTFATPFSLEAGTVYWIVILCDNQTTNNYWQISYIDSDSYADGNMAQSTDGSWGAIAANDLWFRVYGIPLQSYSEATIKTEGSYALKGVAADTTSLNKTLTRAIDPPIDLGSSSQFSFDIYASRTGSNIKIGIHDSGGTTTEVTPNIATVNTWQTVTVDLSTVASANKDAIDSIIITIVNADADNTFYIDDMYGLFSEITTPYSEDEIFDVQYAQLNDVIYLTHKDHPPQKLTRLSASSWTLADFDFIGGPFMRDNTTAITITPSATKGNITITLSATSSTIYFSPSTSTLGHVNSYWKIGGCLTQSTTGLSVQGYVKITSVSTSTVALATVIEDLDGTTTTDDWAEGSWSAVRGYPARVTFYERRLFFARTDSEPQTLWASKPFIYDDFSLNAQADDDGLNLPLASNEANEIMWLAAGDVLVAGTFGGEFVISDGGAGGALTPTNAVSKRYTGWGSDPIVPKKIGNFLYYIQRFGKKLRELSYFFDNNTYKSLDRTIFSPHITGNGIVDMAFQQNPENILWCVRSDGQMATFTREIDQEVQAWSRQVTDGLYESVACIPSQESPYDEVWVVVNRTINGATKRYIEVFDDMEPGARVDELCYVHSGLSYDAYALTSTSTLSLSATSGTVTLTLSLTTSTISFDATDIGQRVRAIDTDGVNLGTVRITSVSTPTIAIGTVLTAFSNLTTSGLSWGKSAQVISGLGHLEGKEVTSLVDGGLDSSLHTVSNGSITLGMDYFVAMIGLPYDQTIQTLPIEAGSVKGTAQGKIQRINQIGFKVNRSYQGFYFGGDDTKLQRCVFRNPATSLGTPEVLFTGVLPNKTFKGGYEYGAHILIVNSDPLPIELLSIMPSLKTEDK